MEDNKELYKLYTYIEGGDEILNYSDLHVLINKEEYSYKYSSSDIFDRGDKLVLTNLDGKELIESKLEENYVNDLSDLDRLREIYRVRSKIDSYRTLNIDFVDNIKRAYVRPDTIKEPRALRKPDASDGLIVIDYFKEHFIKCLIPLAILLFLFACSFIYYNEGEVNKVISKVLGITTLVYFIVYNAIFIYSYIKNDRRIMKKLNLEYNNYLENLEKYNKYLREYDKYKVENDRIEETKRRLKFRVGQEIKKIGMNLRENLNTLVQEFINDEEWSTSDYLKLIKLMNDEEIDYVDEAIDRWNELYTKENSKEHSNNDLLVEDIDCEEDEDDYEDEEEKYIRSGELIKNSEEENEIVELLKKQNELLLRQHLEETARLRQETLTKAREEARRLEEEKKLQRDIRYQCNTCANRANCATINKSANCARYEWSRAKKYN